MRKETQKTVHRRWATGGFSMIELVIVLAVVMIMMAISLPSIRGTMDGLRLRNVVTTTTSAIQTTRFQAIRDGLRYAIAFTPGTNQASYQISRQPVAGGAFVNVGGPVQVGSGLGTYSANTRMEFLPNGTVTATVGALNFQVSYGTNPANMRTITVSRVGHVQVQ
jgi:Tfp pilus assembly protein FimT